MARNSNDIKKNNALSQTEKRIFILCSAIYILFMMSIQKPWEDKCSWLFGSRLGIYGWDDFISWVLIPLVIFWGILWIRKWKKFW